MSLKRYLVFSFETYYPRGGWRDFHGSFDTLEEAKASSPKGDHAHIVDTLTGGVVAQDWWNETKT